MLMLKYAIVGKDDTFSECPAFTRDGSIHTYDALYDLVDTVYGVEMNCLALPAMVEELFENGEAEYWNPTTRLYARIYDPLNEM